MALDVSHCCDSTLPGPRSILLLSSTTDGDGMNKGKYKVRHCAD
jgi:hypothetical protein